MWVFNLDGFFSAVEHRDKPECVTVRARYKEDLEQLKVKICCSLAVEETPDADYPYRLTIDKLRWSKYLAKEALDINYDNFKKASLKDADVERIEQYHDVWASMAGFGRMGL